MKVILTEEVLGLGSVGQLVNVKSGYARNFLLPRTLAVLANETNQRELAHNRRVLERKRKKLLQESQTLAKKIEGFSFSIEKQVGEEGRIFGTVTSAEILILLENQGIKLAKKHIHFPEDIKKIGDYLVDVKLHSEVSAKLKISVVS